MYKRIHKIIICLFLVVFFGCIFLLGCDGKKEDEQMKMEEYTVTFNVDGEKTNQIVKNGEKASKPIDPVKDGYLFIGWYIKDEVYDFEKAVTRNLELVAKFEEETKEYNVKIIVDDVEETQIVKKGKKAIKPSDPVKDGFVFLGWFIGEEIYDFEKAVTSDLELVAKFEKKSKYDLIKEKGVIVITTSPDYAPFEFIDGTKTGQDRYAGCDIELMKYIAEKLGVELEIIAADFDTTLALLQIGIVDLGIAAYNYKEERGEQFEYSKAYDGEEKQGVIVLKEKVEDYKDLASINKVGNRVAATNNTYQAYYVSQFLPNVIIEGIYSIENGLFLLDSGYVAAVAASSTTADRILADSGDKYVFLEDIFPISEIETQMFALAQKGEDRLIAEINKIIDEVVEKGLYKEWKKEAEELAKELGEL